MNDTDEARLLVFAKAPQPGETKSRLIPLLGAEGAARLQAQLTRRAIRTAVAAGLGPVELWCAPNQRHPCFKALRQEYGVTLRDQQGLDLGQRMFHAAAASWPHRRYTLIMGTDCPRIKPATLRRVVAALRRGRDAVIIPADDGGYVLLGLARLAPELFTGIDWGSARVMAQTRVRLADLQFSFQLLDSLPDLDRPDDCEELRREYPRLWRDLTERESGH